MTLTRIRRFRISSEALCSRRGRLVISLSIYGGAVGAASLLVNLLSRSDFPNIPEHMPADATLLLSGGAAFVCAILAGLIAFWLTGGDERRSARGLIVWLAIGFGFGVLSPAVTGASLPMTTMLLGLGNGLMGVGELPIEIISAIMRAPSFVFTHGVFGLFTGFMAGALFGAGAWLVDRAAYSPSRLVSIYAPYAIAISLGGLLYGIAAFGPPETLARFG